MPGRQPQASSIILAARNSPPEAELPSHFHCCRRLPRPHDDDVAAPSRAALPVGSSPAIASMHGQRRYITEPLDDLRAPTRHRGLGHGRLDVLPHECADNLDRALGFVPLISFPRGRSARSRGAVPTKKAEGTRNRHLSAKISRSGWTMPRLSLAGGAPESFGPSSKARLCASYVRILVTA